MIQIALVLIAAGTTTPLQVGFFSSMESCQQAAQSAKTVNADKPSVQFVCVFANDVKTNPPGFRP